MFAEQGLTDPLFPAIQLLQMVNKLTRAYPAYPVWAFLGELGHAYAANPHALWVAVNDDANAFVSAVLARKRPPLPRFTVRAVRCLPGQSADTYRATSFAAIATGLLRLITPTPVTLTGAPVVQVTVALHGTDAELAARLWDVNPATGQAGSDHPQRLPAHRICAGRHPAGSLRVVASRLDTRTRPPTQAGTHPGRLTHLATRQPPCHDQDGRPVAHHPGPQITASRPASSACLSQKPGLPLAVAAPPDTKVRVTSMTRLAFGTYFGISTPYI